MEEKYKKSLAEIESLRDHLNIRKDHARKSQSVCEQWKERMLQAHEELEVYAGDYKSVRADMTRQYKTMQNEFLIHAQELEIENSKLRERLAEREDQLETLTLNQERVVKEKNEKIDDLQLQIRHMEKAYEGILYKTLDSLNEKLAHAYAEWEKESMWIQVKHKEELMSFGIKPLEY